MVFQLGDFRLHSGQQTKWKIECDALTTDDWAALAAMLVERLPSFGGVTGVPQGGLRLATALAPYCSEVGGGMLIVDDVLTTGKSMEELRQRHTFLGRREPMGAVVFARGPCPSWVTPLFAMSNIE